MTASPACSWDKINGLMPSAPCQEPAVCTTTEACEHGHVNVARACAAHAEADQEDGPGLCYECMTGPDPHDCPVTTVFNWDDPTVPAVVLKEEASAG